MTSTPASSNNESEFWLDRPVLVTGATGMVGGWLVRKLLSHGANIVAVVRDEVPGSLAVTSGDLARVTVVRGDVRDQVLMERAIGEYEIDTVFHLAAQTVVGVANRNPMSTFDTNIRGTWVTLEAARRSPAVRQVVVASSDKAYGSTEPWCAETAPLDAQHPYDASKACADLVARSFAVTFGVPVVITRCGNIFGGGDLNWNRLVPGTIRSVLRNRRPVIRSDGTPVRDYFYVEDAVTAYMTAAEQLARRPELSGAAFNFSNEQPLSVIDMTAQILEAMDSPLEPTVLAQARFEIQEQSLSAAKAKRELGWAAEWSLERSLSETVSWYRGFLAAPSPPRRTLIEALAPT